MNTLDDLQDEVSCLADKLTPELLPALLERMLQRDWIIPCHRHLNLLLPYIEAQITLTHAKRVYFDDHSDCLRIAENYHFSLKRRNEIRKTYRSTLCTCWVPKH